MQMTEGQIRSIIQDYQKNPSDQDLSQKVRSLLLDGTEDQRFLMTSELAKNRIKDFNAIIEENMLSDGAPGIRSTSFWALTLLGDKHSADSLLEAMEMEDNPDAIISEIDNFVIFAQMHNISSKAIVSNQNLIKTTSQSILSRPSTVTKKIEIPEETYFASENSDVRVESEPQVLVTEPHQQETSDRQKLIEINKARTRVKRTLLDLTPNIPITLDRLAEVTGVTNQSLENYLSDLSKSNPEAGRFFPLEQVFVKQSATISQVLAPTKSIKTCSSCGAVTTKFPCESCGEGTQCSTCKLPIGQDEQTIHCPFCKKPSHTNHLQEWVRIKGNCPNCKEQLNETMF